jgi:hypothetical protein
MDAVSTAFSIRNNNEQMRFQVLTAASMKMAVFWYVARCGMVEVYKRFKDDYCRHYQGDHSDNGGQQAPLKLR